MRTALSAARRVPTTSSEATGASQPTDSDIDLGAYSFFLLRRLTASPSRLFPVASHTTERSAIIAPAPTKTQPKLTFISAPEWRLKTAKDQMRQS